MRREEPDGSNPESELTPAEKLRARAERELETHGLPNEPALPGDLDHILHELRVHQIELEMQNDELRRTQIELEASRAKYFELYDLAPVGYVTLGHEGDVAEANLTAAATLGIHRGELVGARFSDFVVAEDQDDYYLFWRQLTTSGAARPRDLRLKRRGGEPLWVHVEGSDDRHAPSGASPLRIAFTNIHPRVLADKQLASREALLQSVIDSAPFGAHMYELHPDDRLVFTGCNRMAAEMLGIDHESLIGKTLEEAFPGNVGTELPEAYRKAAREGTRYENSAFTYDAEGIDGVFEIHAFSNGPDRMVVFFREVSEKRALEAQLRRTEQRYRLLFDNMIEACLYCEMIYDEAGKPVDWRYLDVNDSFRHMIDDREIKGKTSSEAFPGLNGESPWMLDLFASVVLSGDPAEFDIHYPPLDRWFHVSILRPETGRFFAVYLDITDSKQSEAKALDTAAQLEREVAGRTSELNAANESLESFAYSVSHDLRTPLRHIDSFVELLGRSCSDKLDDQSRHYMQTISESAERMNLLINDLLSFSRMGRQEFHVGSVGMDAVFDRAIRDVAPRVGDRDIKWRIAELPDVPGDPGLMQVVVSNLIENAVKFTSPVPHAVIEVGFDDSSAEEIVYFVRDNGVGYDEAYSDKLFGVFQRLHSVDEFEGTGIGLATARRIVERFGGRIWAEGKVGRGATFYFALPRKVEEVAT